MRLLQCLNPTSGWRLRGVNPRTGRKYGMIKAEVARQYPPSMLEEVAFRCGKCINCIKYRGSVLMARCVAESMMHDDNVFITLNVDDDHIGEVYPGSSLSHRPWQLFVKRLRKACRSSGIKYIMCGEYGEISMRPHYHAIIFGLPAYKYVDTHVMRPDGLGYYKQREDNDVYQACWSYGTVYCGSVTPASIAYVSGYTLKQFVLGRDKDWYVDRHLAPEYVKWSRRPGIGRSYFEQYDIMDDYADGTIDCGVPIDGRRVFPGRYFLDWLRLTSADEYDKLLSSYERGNSSDSESEIDELRSALAERDRRADVAIYNTLRSRRI